MSVDVFAQWKLSPCSLEPGAAGFIFLNPQFLLLFKKFCNIFIQVGMAVGGQKAEDKWQNVRAFSLLDLRESCTKMPSKIMHVG